MRLLIRRYVTADQRKRDDFGITEDDVMEIRQDISSLRFELIDILHGNGMKTPTLDKDGSGCKCFLFVEFILCMYIVAIFNYIHIFNYITVANKKGKAMERRILGDFQIGAVADIGEAKVVDIFASIAKTIGGKKETTKR